MLELIKTYLLELAGLVNEMSPYLLLGFFFAGLLRVAFPTRVITRYMGGSNFLASQAELIMSSRE
jgi:uncharacterized membrane protein YraQ (UPF0718 family)